MHRVPFSVIVGAERPAVDKGEHVTKAVSNTLGTIAVSGVIMTLAVLSIWKFPIPGV